MKRTKIIYRIVTILISFGLGLGSVFNAMSSKESLDLVHDKLGYPAYLVPFLGVAKLVGIAVILIPGFRRLKEWAYAGLAFDLIGAVYSHIAIGAPIGEWAPLFILISLLGISYIFHHKVMEGNVAQ
ncbi:MAG TPA: DoxX family protein [Cyclobacteriaceae bacterium]|nr:DoxX family protein [Cyclobacteriaceae bacterium]